MCVSENMLGWIIVVIKDNFLLKQIAGDYIVVPVGEKLVDFSAMIVLNETGVFLWKLLKEEKTVTQLVEAVVAEYDIDRGTAESDVGEFIAMLKEKDLVA